MWISEIRLSLDKQAVLLLGVLLATGFQSAKAEQSKVNSGFLISESPGTESSAATEKPASEDTDWINKSLDTSDPENPFAESSKNDPFGKSDPFGKTGDLGSKAELTGASTSSGSNLDSKASIQFGGSAAEFHWPVSMSACSEKESAKEKEKEKEKNRAAGKSDESEKPWLTKYKEGKSLFDQGNYDQAEDVFKQAIKLADEGQAVEPGVVDCFVALAMVKDKQGDVAEAERLYEFAMRSIEGVRSSIHPRYGDYLPNLALLYFSHGKNDLARYSLDRLMNIRFKNPGDNKEDLAAAYEAYSRFLSATGDQAESEIYSKKAQTLRYGH